jgi:putative inorganic carbon (HCO3(-)) transporter
MTPFLLVALAAFALLAWKDHRRAFFLFVGLLPTYVIRFTVGGLPTTALEILFWILFAGWMFKREKRFVDIQGWRLLMLLWLTVATVEAFVSPDLHAAAGVWKAYFIEPVMFFILANDVLRAAEDRAKVAIALAWTAILLGAITTYQYFTHFAVPDPWNLPGQYRATAFYGFPNATGLFLAPLIPLFAWLSGQCAVGETKNRRRLILFLAAIVASFVAIVMVQSKGAAIGATAGLIVLGLVNAKIRKPLILGLAALAVIVAIIPVTRNLAVNTVTLNGWSGRVRKVMWSETWNMFKDHAILGAGISGYPIVFDKYHEARYLEIFQYPHDIFLNFWSELGLAGVALLLWTLWLVFKSKQWPLIAVFTAIVVHGLVDVPYFKNDLSILWWLLLALIVSQQAELRKLNKLKNGKA